MNGGLYRFNVKESVSFQTEFDKNLSPHVLWHRRPGHISQARMKRLIKEGIISILFESFRVIFNVLKVNYQKGEEMINSWF